MFGSRIVFGIAMSHVGNSMKNQEQLKDRISEQEYRDRFKNLMKTDVITRLEPLKLLKTATKKRRELKKKACAK